MEITDMDIANLGITEMDIEGMPQLIRISEEEIVPYERVIHRRPKNERQNVSMQTRFHRFHGNNLSLHDQDTVAQREISFANAIVFSERPLSPGEVFLIEIESSENGWSGHIRLGLTQLDPDRLQRDGHLLPQCAIPDMMSNKNMGDSWICALTKHQAWFESNYLPNYFRVDGNHVFTSRGTFPTSILRSSVNSRVDKLPTDVGSRIGVLYLPNSENTATMHFIINGEFVVPMSRTIPFNDGPIRAVIDVYGATKRVRIVQVYNGETVIYINTFKFCYNVVNMM